MTRPDAWLTDPFGAGLGRWGGAPSGSAPAPAWYQPIVDLVGDGFVCVYTEGVETTDPGAQVTAWNDVRGTPVWSSYGATSTRPTLGGGGILADGIDDKFEANNFAPLLDGAYTLLMGFDDPEDSSLSSRTLLCASELSSSVTTRQISINYSRPGVPASVRQRVYIADTGASSIFLTGLSPIGAGPYDLCVRSGAPGATYQADRLDGVLTAIGSTTRPNNSAPTYDWLTLGCRAVGALPTLAQYWQGRVRFVILADSRLNDTELATIRTTLLTQTGLIT